MKEYKQGIVEGLEMALQLVKDVLNNDISEDKLLAEYNKLVIYGADLYLEIHDEQEAQLSLFGNTLIEEMIEC